MLFYIQIILLFVISFICGPLLNIYQLVQECRHPNIIPRFKLLSRISLVGIAFIFCIDFFIYVNGPSYQVALTNLTEPYFHEIISSEYGNWLYIIMILGFLSLFIVRIKHKVLPPLVSVILFSFIFLQIAVWIVCGIQLYEHIGRKSVQLAYFCSINILIYEARVIIQVIHSFPVEKYQITALSFPKRLLYNSRNWSWIALLFTFPILIICILVLCLFGQQPDNIVKAFTQTSDWFLSQQVSPPKLPHEGHYLCTVSVQGHRRLVKPLRWGVRGGSRIWVNRQLLIANAFEQILEERIPRIHRTIRYLYDRYGYPIARHIKTPISADIVYILMKPMEYIFLAVIYLFDTYPESRIARQYLPGCKKITFIHITQ